MSEENVEVVREAYDAYSRGDYDRLEGIHDPHIVVVTFRIGTISAAGLESWAASHLLTTFLSGRSWWESAE
jgi:ketosteroid isomerase-like protein